SGCSGAAGAVFSGAPAAVSFTSSALGAVGSAIESILVNMEQAGISGFGRQKSSGSRRQQPTHHPRRVIHHRDDARVIEAGRADHADDADDAALAVAVWRDDGGGTGKREQLVLQADEDAHAIPPLGAAEQVD